MAELKVQIHVNKQLQHLAERSKDDVRAAERALIVVEDELEEVAELLKNGQKTNHQAQTKFEKSHKQLEKTLQTLLEQRKRCAGAIEEKIEEKDEFLRWEGVGTGIARKRECILLGIDVEEEEQGSPTRGAKDASPSGAGGRHRGGRSPVGSGGKHHRGSRSRGNSRDEDDLSGGGGDGDNDKEGSVGGEGGDKIGDNHNSFAVIARRLFDATGMRKLSEISQVR